MPTGLVYDPRFLLHDTGPGHPERPQRLTAIIDRLKSSRLLDRLTPIPATPAPLDRITAVHHPDYIARLRAACQAGDDCIDTQDSAICPETYDTALLAAGGVLNAADAIMSASISNAFCAVRPPGHHAEPDRSMGFCFFDNIAVAAAHLLSHHKLQRVAIVDFDVHHGNGTQRIFESRNDVLFISLHEHPMYLYPGTGFSHERGTGAGQGFTLNIPLDPGSGDPQYHHAFTTLVLPALDQFKPQFLLVSAGFDASASDPLAHMKVTPEGFTWITQQLKSAAQRHCHGRLLSTLEGGYDLASLSECVSRHITVLLDEPRP